MGILFTTGMFSATKYTVFGHTDIFVDGGVLCNYPVHCFDGKPFKPVFGFILRSLVTE